jgi:MFS transporter, ACS family, solute carrier family 17 (sodium-dependent inorganic phosphate cotransporter), member 5
VKQSEALGAFFTLHWATQLPGGMLAARYGTKKIFGLANWIGCVTCILVPLAAYLNFYALFALRLIQGFVAGAAWPGKKMLIK